MNDNLVCETHGYTKHTLTGNTWVCVECRREKTNDKKIKQKRSAVAYKGGKCCICGYDKHLSALEFHHKDPHTKEFNISSKTFTNNFYQLKIELDKCILVCANCHRAIHNNAISKKDLNCCK